MRIGQNPAKFISHVARPKDVTVAIVTYLPFLGGYYSHGLDVLKASLTSLMQNTAHPYDLLVFDNGSDKHVQSYLQEQYAKGSIQYLVLSEKNLGKGGAWNFIFGASPGEYLAYADGDIFFKENWLAKSLEIMHAFPKVGMVTARPLRSKERYYSKTLEWAQQANAAVLEKGQFLDWDVFYEHTRSCGVSVEQSKEWFHESYDWRVQYRGITAFAGAAHFQFLARKDDLQELLPFEMEKPMGQVRMLDEKLNEAGFLRLMTAEPLVAHMGNTLSILDKGPKIEKLQSNRFFEWPPIKKGLMLLYNKIFQIYYGRVSDL